MENCFLRNECTRKHCNDPEGCRILSSLTFLYDDAMLPNGLRTKKSLYTDEDGTDSDSFKILANIEKNINANVKKGNNYFIYSSQAGNGKTSWAVRLLQAYLKSNYLTAGQGCKGLFISVPKFLLDLKSNISTRSDYIAHIQANVMDCDLVIWDDISSKTGTEFEISHLLNIIDYRLNANKSNVYTSNIAPEDLKNYLDIRLGSRIATASECIKFKGGDKRFLKGDN